ncbi:hypothetical protein NPIL_49211 [Nephila pilipes]|uniref:Uncharacterized protein n=1 Tax=Nephila pilipes TaxID=299642 RepID=A0A8X6I8U9_NEPPI|nr:hypothetical protein NPIL_49211 [Nephila pilipes]
MSQQEKREDTRGQLPLSKEKRFEERMQNLENIDLLTVIGIQDIKYSILGLGIVPQKREPSGTSLGSTITAAKPSRSLNFLVLIAKINVLLEATTNVAELLTTLVRIGHQKIRGIIYSGSRILVICKEFTHGV